MVRAERPDHKYTIPTYGLPIVLELSTLEVRPTRNGKSRDSRFVTSLATLLYIILLYIIVGMSHRAGFSAPAAAHREAAAFLFREWEGLGVSRVMHGIWNVFSFLVLQLTR